MVPVVSPYMETNSKMKTSHSNTTFRSSCLWRTQVQVRTVHSSSSLQSPHLTSTTNMSSLERC